jgi:hypothetical protein
VKVTCANGHYFDFDYQSRLFVYPISLAPTCYQFRGLSLSCNALVEPRIAANYQYGYAVPCFFLIENLESSLAEFIDCELEMQCIAPDHKMELSYAIKTR